MSMYFKWEMVVLFDSYNKGSIFIVLVRICICAFFCSDSFFLANKPHIVSIQINWFLFQLIVANELYLLQQRKTNECK